MNERDIMNVLQSDIVIPEIVQKKANTAFQKIRESSVIDGEEKANARNDQKRKPRMKKGE